MIRNKKERIADLIFFLVISFFIGWKICVNSTETSSVKVALCIASAIIALLYVYCLSLLRSRKTISCKDRRAVYVLSAILTLIVFVPLVPQLMQEHAIVQVTIECGEKNENAHSSEFWLSSLTRNGIQHSVKELQITQLENVKYSSEHDAYLYTNSNGSGNGSITIQLNGDEDIFLVFSSHSYCGIVYVENSVNQKREKIDLYSPYSTKYHYYVPSGTLSPLMQRIALCIGILAIIYSAIQIALFVIICFVKYLKIRKIRFATLALGGASLLFPISYLMFQYGQNPSEVAFPMIVAYEIIMAIVMLVVYSLLLIIADSALVGFIGCALLVIWNFSSSCVNDLLTGIVDPLKKFDHSGTSTLLLGGVCCLCFLIVIFKLHNKENKSNIHVIIFAFSLLLFLFNTPTAIINYIHQINAKDEFTFKEEFVISDNNEIMQPNIYWFHCDGMLGFSAYEKYFQDDQFQFAQELEQRGFRINRDAYFEAGHATVMAIPSLMSPDFHDKYLTKIVEETPDRAKLHNLTENSTLGETLRLARLNSELLTAFNTTGKYTIVQLLRYTNQYYPPIGNINYETSDDKIYRIDTDPEESKSTQTIYSASEFSRLENFLDHIALPTTIIIRELFPQGFESLSGMFEKSVERIEVAYIEKDPINIHTTQALKYALEETSSPRMVLYFDSIAHNPYIYDENGNIISEPSMNVMAYPPQHIYASKVYMNAIDLILLYDPDAIIILQADHGLHGNTKRDFQLAFGEDVQEDELWNQVMSAVRIPEKYCNGEEIYAYTNPLNISRYLVNRFVGQNYEYLPANTPITQ